MTPYNNSNNSKINLSDLISVCHSIAQYSSIEIYNSVKNNISYNIYDKISKKKINEFKQNIDPQTEIDVKVQQIILANLKYAFSNLLVIAEEGDSVIENFNPPIIFPNNNSVDFGNKKPFFDKEFDIKDFTIWVDPLDGTKDFIKKNYDCVTVLIGGSYKNNPIFGVIVSPFLFGKNGKPIVALGATDPKSSKKFFHTNLEIQTKKNQSRRNLVISRYNFGVNNVENFLNYFNPTKITKMSGCGRKMLTLLNGENDAFIFPHEGTKKWDTCAPQAILESIGGKFTTPVGDKLKYDTNDVENREGFIASINHHKEYLLIKIE